MVQQFEKMREDSLAEILKKEEGLKLKESELKEAAIRLKEKAQNLNDTAISNLKKTKSMEASPKLIAINRKHYESLKQKKDEDEEDKLEETANFKNFMDAEGKMTADSITTDKDRVRRSITQKYYSKSRSRSPTTSPENLPFMKGTVNSQSRNNAIKKRVEEDKMQKSIKQKDKEMVPVLDGKEFLTIQEFVADPTFIDLK